MVPVINKQVLDFSDEVQTFIRKNYYSDFKLARRSLDWKPSRRTIRGGMYKVGPGFNLAMYTFSTKLEGQLYRFNEYASFANSPTIGSIYYYFTKKTLNFGTKALALHEIAHAIQMVHYRRENVRCKPHGPIFKRYYEELREEFLNPYLENQKELKRDYEDYIRKLDKPYNIKVISK